MKNKSNALVQRVFKPKKANTHFYCPLCRSKRYFLLSSKLKKKNYGHILVFWLLFSTLFYPLTGWKGFLIWPFPVATVYEVLYKLTFRKEVPCPHCGFDMTWYRRDVKVAKQQVIDFWSSKNSPETS